MLPREARWQLLHPWSQSLLRKQRIYHVFWDSASLLDFGAGSPHSRAG